MTVLSVTGQSFVLPLKGKVQFMVYGGYHLEFETEAAAEAAVLICRKRSEGTDWHIYTEVHSRTVFVKTDSPITAEAFQEETFEEGNTLFQQICFSLISADSKEPFHGESKIEYKEDKVKQRFRVTYDGERLHIQIRRTSKDSIQFWNQDWVQKGNRFEKEFSACRRKERSV